MPSTARAVSRTVPPSARIVPVFVTSESTPSGARVTAPVTFTVTILSP